MILHSPNMTKAYELKLKTFSPRFYPDTDLIMNSILTDQIKT